MKHTYLLINLLTISIPFIFSFHPRIRFYMKWKSFLVAAILTGSVFILWDVLFTEMGIWGFNADYLSGLYIINLPLEEFLFFLCIPFACMFTYHSINLYKPFTPDSLTVRKIIFAFALLLLIAGIFYRNQIYTSITAFSSAIVLIWLQSVGKVKWLGRALAVYSILLLPFLLVNGVLTGTGIDAPIVWYNEAEITGLRILTIPVEDAFYGMELILLNIYLYESFSEKFK